MMADEKQPDRMPVPRAWREEFDGLKRYGTRKPRPKKLLESEETR